MPNGTLPDVDPSVRPADLERAGVWLAGHGLADVEPTPLLATRLAARRRTRLAAAVLLAAFICAVALAYVNGGPTGAAVDGFGPHRPWSLLVLTALVVGLVLAQSLLDWWVRRVDRRAGATLPRRAAHPVQPGWRTVLGRPHAAFAVATFAGAMVLAIGALTVQDPTARYAAVILLIGLCGVAVGTVVQLRHVLTHPVVAEDEVSLTADVIMRVEDARDVATPTVVWSLPVVSVFGTALGWWNAAWLVFIVLGVIALALVNAWTARSGVVARHAMSARYRMIVIDAASPVPPFEQLRAQLARQIQDRTLAVGTRLPTIRRLAADLGLAVNTVGRAYRELEEAGLIETRGRAGSFVSAAGEEGRERARRAAADYAAVIASVGIDTNEAIRIVQAALTKGIAVSPSP